MASAPLLEHMDGDGYATIDDSGRSHGDGVVGGPRLRKGRGFIMAKNQEFDGLDFEEGV